MPDENKSVSLWHPWMDKPGQRHLPVLWGDTMSGLSTEDIIQKTASEQLYVFCNDVLGEQPEQLVIEKNRQVAPYISRTGKVVALQLRHKGMSGFIIPGSVWGCKIEPDSLLLGTVSSIFRRFKYEAITAASLSEKVLRSTLPDKCFISRPSVMLRMSLLANSYGGRIDTVAIPRRIKRLYNYDQVKSYLYHARTTVSPFQSPTYLYYGERGYQDNRWSDFKQSWLLCTFTAHVAGIQPIQIKDQETGEMREPHEGECFTVWLWSYELIDCLEAGYTLENIDRCYCWRETSSWMEEWSDILWDQYQESSSHEQDIIKGMMVGLPGRFLKAPENYAFIRKDEYQKGDDPVLLNWSVRDDGRIISDYFIRTTPDMESAQLTHVGHDIVRRCRQEMYHIMKKEEQRGNRPVRSYIDCVSFEAPATTIPLGTERGMFKEHIDRNVVVEENRVIPYKGRVRAPGYGEKDKEELWRKYHG